MLFSNLVTDLSANSARVSACEDLIWVKVGKFRSSNSHKYRKNYRMKLQSTTWEMGLKLPVSVTTVSGGS
jgi:hypothetical protein